MLTITTPDRHALETLMMCIPHVENEDMNLNEVIWIKNVEIARLEKKIEGLNEEMKRYKAEHAALEETSV